VMSTASNSSLKQSCSALTSVTSALEVIFNVMRSINTRFTYLLTFIRQGVIAHWKSLTQHVVEATVKSRLDRQRREMDV